MAKKGKTKKSLKGSVFGELKVIGTSKDWVSGSGRHFRQWKCQCSCGKVIVAVEQNLLSGNTTSCGCSRRSQWYGEKDTIMESVQRIHNDKAPQDPWHRLAGAIVAAAADDYRIALKSGNRKMQSSVEEFFRSKWYRVLTTVDPEKLMKRLREEDAEDLAVCG